MGVSEAMINCYEEPDMVEIILEKATQFLVEYIKAFKAAGADAYTDDAASAAEQAADYSGNKMKAVPLKEKDYDGEC